MKLLKISKIFFSIIISFLVLLLPFRVADAACLNDEDDHLYSFTRADVVEQSPYAPFLLRASMDRLLNYYELQSSRSIRDNVEEWQRKFCEIGDTAEVEYVLYTASEAELYQLLEATLDEKKDRPYQLEANTFARGLKKKQCIETIEYLLFTRRCEPYAKQISGWQTRYRDSTAMLTIAREGEDAFYRCKSPFLRLRYLYQLVRLAHYARNYAVAIKIYDNLMPRVHERVSSIVRWWVLAHKAGALMALGQRGEANYLFAQVFRNCPSRRESAHLSFEVRSEGEWRDCINRCKTSDEHATLHALRAYAPKSKGLDDLKAVHLLDPKSEFLTIIALREVVKMENIFLGKQFRLRKATPSVRQSTAQYLIDFQQFIHKVALEGNTFQPALWFMIDGYLMALKGDYTNALKMFEFVRPSVKTPELLDQLDVFEVATRICIIQSSEPSSDKAWYNLRQSNGYAADPDFERFFREKVAQTYLRLGHRGIAFICNYSLNDLLYNPNQAYIDDLITLCKKENKTDFERELTARTSRATIEGDLLDIKGSMLLMRGEVEAASLILREVPPALLKRRMFNPFSETIKECVHCRRVDTLTINRLQLAMRLVDLKFEATAAQQDAGAPAYFKLGLAFYNMSYFGTAWQATDYYRSGASWWLLGRSDVGHVKGKVLGNRENFDCSLALSYFEKARSLTKNAELGAKAAFWAAKCQQKIYFNTPNCMYRPNQKSAPKLPPQYQQYFYLLKNYYQHTQYYQNVVKECSFFRMYVSR